MPIFQAIASLSLLRSLWQPSVFWSQASSMQAQACWQDSSASSCRPCLEAQSASQRRVSLSQGPLSFEIKVLQDSITWQTLVVDSNRLIAFLIDLLKDASFSFNQFLESSLASFPIDSKYCSTFSSYSSPMVSAFTRELIKMRQVLTKVRTRSFLSVLTLLELSLTMRKAISLSAADFQKIVLLQQMLSKYSSISLQQQSGLFWETYKWLARYVNLYFWKTSGSSGSAIEIQSLLLSSLMDWTQSQRTCVMSKLGTANKFENLSSLLRVVQNMILNVLAYSSSRQTIQLNSSSSAFYFSPKKRSFLN